MGTGVLREVAVLGSTLGSLKKLRHKNQRVEGCSPTGHDPEATVVP